MTRDDIIRMLQECGFGTLADHPIMTENMVRFAALVAAAQREACAKVCESEAAKLRNSDSLTHYLQTDKHSSAIASVSCKQKQ